MVEIRKKMPQTSFKIVYILEKDPLLKKYINNFYIKIIHVDRTGQFLLGILQNTIFIKKINFLSK